MPDILYPISICGALVVLVKRDFQLVAFNESGMGLTPLTPLDEIGYANDSDLNRLTVVKAFTDNLYVLKKRTEDERALQEVQDAQLALDLERYLHGVERSFVIEELCPAWYPVKMLVDVLKIRAEYNLPEIKLLQLASDLVIHADHLVRQNLTDSGIRLPIVSMTVEDNSPYSAAPAVRLALNYFEQTMDDYTQAHTEEVAWRVERLLKERI